MQSLLKSNVTKRLIKYSISSGDNVRQQTNKATGWQKRLWNTSYTLRNNIINQIIDFEMNSQ